MGGWLYILWMHHKDQSDNNYQINSQLKHPLKWHVTISAHKPKLWFHWNSVVHEKTTNAPNVFQLGVPLHSWLINFYFPLPFDALRHSVTQYCVFIWGVRHLLASDKVMLNFGISLSCVCLFVFFFTFFFFGLLFCRPVIVKFIVMFCWMMFNKLV